MRNRTKKELPIFIPAIDKEQLLSAKLDEALKEIANLKKIIAQNSPNESPWIFDIERDTHGRIKGVTAQKETDSHFVM